MGRIAFSFVAVKYGYKAWAHASCIAAWCYKPMVYRSLFYGYQPSHGRLFSQVAGSGLSSVNRHHVPEWMPVGPYIWQILAGPISTSLTGKDYLEFFV